jgi:hypothetical protein
MASGSNFKTKYLSYFSGLTSGSTVNYQQLNHGGQVPTNNSRPKPSNPVIQKPFVPFSAQTLVERSVLESRSTGNTVSSSGGTKQVSLSSISGMMGISTPFTAGTLDTSFIDGVLNYGFDVNSSNGVRDIVIQPDGKILMGGDFYAYTHNDYTYDSNGLIRLNTDGSVDETFDIMYNPDCYGGGFYGDPLTLALQPDGKILAGGRFTYFDRDGNCDPANYIIRLNSDGSRDNTFNIGNGFDNYVEKIKLLSDGSMFVGGDFYGYNGTDATGIIKLNSTGGIDPSFSIGTDSVSFDGIVYSIEVDSNGKILVGGNFSTYSGVSALSIIRLNSDGTIDNTFNSGTGFDGIVNSIVVEPEGTILVGGGFTTYNNVTGVGNLVRLNADGTINTRFGYGFNNIVNVIKLQSDGKILVGGYFDYYFYDINNQYAYVDVYDLIRLNRDGSVDNTFYYGQLLNDTVESIAIQSNDYIIIGGSFNTYGDYNPQYALRLYNQVVKDAYVYVVYDCLQPLMDSSVTYTVSSTVPLNVGDTYSLQSISNPSVIVFGTISNDIPSTTVTHTLLKQYDSCEAALSGSTKLVIAKDCFGLIPDFNYLVDSRFKVGDIMFADIVFDFMGGPAFIKTPVTIIEEIPFVLDEYWPKLIPYQTYGTCLQAIEANGIYFEAEECVSGETSYFLSKIPFLEPTFINVPNGASDCKNVVNILTFAPYELISAGTVVIQSTFTYKSCADCLSKFESAVINSSFAQNTYNDYSVTEIKQLNDGSLLIGGDNLTHFDDGDLYNIGNIIKLTSDGAADFSFNKNSEGSLYLDGSTFIYANYNELFNLDQYFSIECWIKFSTHGFNGGIISFKDSNADNGWQLRFDGDSNYLAFEYNNDTSVSDIELNTDEWYHIAIVNNCDSNYLRMYINGNYGYGFDVSCTSGLNASEGTTLKIGVERTYGTYMTGVITNVRIVNGGDNFAYEDNFTIPTSPLRNAQDSYGNIRTVSQSEVVLLLNFIDKFSILSDSSVYKTPFYINKPDVAKSAEKCFCTTWTNTGTTQVIFSYYPCFEPGTGGGGVQTVTLSAGQTYPSTCAQSPGYFGVYPSNAHLVQSIGTLADGKCVLAGPNVYLCPGVCNCYSVKNNTSSPIELKYYDCNRSYITGTWVTPGQPEISVCARHFDPSNLTIVDQGYQCSATTAVYPYGWTCIPPIDPRCQPLILFHAPSNFTITTPLEFQVSRNPLVPNLSPTLLNLGNYNLPLAGSSQGVTQFSTDIAHILDFTANTGWMWISYVPNTVASTLIILEWKINDANFNLTYNRQIKVSQTGTTTSVLRPGYGIAGIDRNTLIIGATTGTTNGYLGANLRGIIAELNINPSNGNNLNYNTHATAKLKLPIDGQVINSFQGSITVTKNQIAWSDLVYTIDNRVIVSTKRGDGQGVSTTIPPYVIQYQYVLNASPEFAIAMPQNVSHGVLTYAGKIIRWNQLGNTPGGAWGGNLILNNSPYTVSGYADNFVSASGTQAFGSSSANVSSVSVSLCNQTRFFS